MARSEWTIWMWLIKYGVHTYEALRPKDPVLCFSRNRQRETPEWIFLPDRAVLHAQRGHVRVNKETRFVLNMLFHGWKGNVFKCNSKNLHHSSFLLFEKKWLDSAVKNRTMWHALIQRELNEANHSFLQQLLQQRHMQCSWRLSLLQNIKWVSAHSNWSKFKKIENPFSNTRICTMCYLVAFLEHFNCALYLNFTNHYNESL